MFSYTMRRLAQWIPVLIVASVIVFAIVHLLPGDPAELLAGPDGTTADVEAIRQHMGLSRPLPAQYWSWLNGLFHGDLGSSYVYHVPAFSFVIDRFPASLELSLSAVLIALVVGIPAGTAAALRQGKLVDWCVSTASATLMAIPNFWVAILAIIVFALDFRWLPPGGTVAFGQNPALAVQSLVLPAVTLSLGAMAHIARMTRYALLDVLREDYVRTAHAKGLGFLAILVRHEMRNAAPPVLTLAAIVFGRTLGGAVIIENVFAWPGVGHALIQAINNRDYAVVQASLLVLLVMFLVINLVVDLLYGVIDPRVKAAITR